MKIEFLPICQICIPSESLAFVKEVSVNCPISIWKEEVCRSFSTTVFLPPHHEGSRDWNLASFFGLTGPLPLKAKIPVGLRADVQDVGMEP